jgi:hypothetical protein
VSTHDINDWNTIAGEFFQPKSARSHLEACERLEALVREMEQLDRVVVLVRDFDADDGRYIVTHHPKRINVRPRRVAK